MAKMTRAEWDIRHKQIVERLKKAETELAKVAGEHRGFPEIEAAIREYRLAKAAYTRGFRAANKANVWAQKQ